MSYQTGFFGIPGRYGGQVHVIQDGRPICGRKMHPKAEFQWCAHGIRRGYIECKRCMEKARKLTEAVR